MRGHQAEETCEEAREHNYPHICLDMLDQAHSQGHEQPE